MSVEIVPDEHDRAAGPPGRGDRRVRWSLQAKDSRPPGRVFRRGQRTRRERCPDLWQAGAAVERLPKTAWSPGHHAARRVLSGCLRPSQWIRFSVSHQDATAATSPSVISPITSP